MPSIAELLVAELDKEMPGTRRALERVPEGQNDWKPHEKSMAFGTRAFDSNVDMIRTFDEKVAAGRAALAAVSDERLLGTSWRLMMKGQVLSEETRYQAVRGGALNHLYHHRAQLGIYLRLNQQPVPSLYGPSADEPFPGG
jgi:hypothetical protein